MAILGYISLTLPFQCFVKAKKEQKAAADLEKSQSKQAESWGWKMMGITMGDEIQKLGYDMI